MTISYPNQFSSGDAHNMRAGFTLFEIAIVLTIFALVIGGIIVGRDLIRAAALSGVARQYEAINGATQRFVDKYNAVPGDMKNATQFWDVAAASNCWMSYNAASTKTCNGNGDGQISTYPSETSSGGSSTDAVFEQIFYWQHLINAGYLTGTMKGFQGLNSSAKDAYWAPYWGIAIMGGNGYFGIPNYGNNILIYWSIYPATEIAVIDTKIDDGMPGMGKMVVFANNNQPLSKCTTATSTNDFSAKYKGSTATCGFMMRDAF